MSESYHWLSCEVNRCCHTCQSCSWDDSQQFVFVATTRASLARLALIAPRDPCDPATLRLARLCLFHVTGYDHASLACDSQEILLSFSYRIILHRSGPSVHGGPRASH